MANTSIFSAFERLWQHITVALNKKADKSDVKFAIYNSIADIGLTGTVTTDDIFQAMPNHSMLIISTPSGATISDMPTTYSVLTFTKITNYGTAEAIKINAQTTSVYKYMWYWNSTTNVAGSHNGWFEVLTNEAIILSSSQYGNALPSAGTAGRVFFKKVSS